MKKWLKITAFTLITAVALSVGAVAVTDNYQINAPKSAQMVAVITANSNKNDVKLIQKKLKNWGYYKGAIDGIYGSGTKKAVILFQKRNGLAVDGIVGNKTLSAMGISQSQLSTSGGSSGGANGYSSQDVALLARLLYAEARGETYKGQVAVGAVVLNRVKSSSFPNTIAGVIYQPYAFTCVADGQINYTPNSTAYNAARDAMNGWDPSYGSIYYYNPKVATSGWIFTRPTVVTIGNHVFAS